MQAYFEARRQHIKQRATLGAWKRMCETTVHRHSYFSARKQYITDCRDRRLKRGMWERESYTTILRGKARLVAAYNIGAECFARSWAAMSFPERQHYLENPQSRMARETLQNAEFRSLLNDLCWVRRVPALNRNL